MKSNIDKVYSKLPQKKHNFKNHKVALSLVDDIVNSYENIKSEADDLREKINLYKEKIVTENLGFQ